MSYLIYINYKNTLKREFLKFPYHSVVQRISLKWSCVSFWAFCPPHAALVSAFYILLPSCSFFSLFLYFCTAVSAHNLEHCQYFVSLVPWSNFCFPACDILFYFILFYFISFYSSLLNLFHFISNLNEIWMSFIEI